MAGTIYIPGVGIPMQLDSLLLNFLLLYDPELPEVRFDGQRFDATYREFERSYYASTVQLQMVMPFWDLVAPSDQPVQLTPDVTLRELSKREFPSRPLSMVGRAYGLVTTFEVPFPADEEAWSKINDQGRRAEATLEGVCAALSLFKHGNCAALGTMISSESLILSCARTSSSRRAGDGTLHATYRIESAEVDEIRSLCRAVLSDPVRDNGALQVATRRFLDSVYRSSDQDRLLDLVIASESLFGLRDPIERSYRIALHAAVYLTPPTQSPAELLKLFKDAYKWRSRLAHGGAAVKPDEMREFVVMTHRFESALRDALKRYALDTANGRPPKWEALIEQRLTHLES